jgi:hypothetical protein
VNEDLRAAGERAAKRACEEYVRKDIERLKQTGEYDELVKRRQAVLDAQKSKEN